MTVWFLDASATLGNTMAYLACGQGEFDFANSPFEDYTFGALALMHSLQAGPGLHRFQRGGLRQICCRLVCNHIGRLSIGMKHGFWSGSCRRYEMVPHGPVSILVAPGLLMVVR
jgi:hypothetical protein